MTSDVSPYRVARASVKIENVVAGAGIVRVIDNRLA